MPDIEGLSAFSYEPDRDFARFFAGRERELNQLARAVADVKSKWDSGYRFIGGATVLICAAPGSGKTSLLNYFSAQYCNGDDTTPLGVRVGLQDINTDDQLHRLILKFHRHSKPLASLLHSLIVDTAKFARLNQTVGDINSAYDSLDMSQTNQRPVCILIDEIQNADKQSAYVLRRLHEGVQGIPCVPIFAGLPNSDHVMRELGVSRLGSQSRISLGTLSNDECRDAIQQMFEKFEVSGSQDAREHWIHSMASRSFGFPHHLHNVMSCVAAELSNNQGSLDSSDLDHTLLEIDRRRYRYYESRIDRIIAELPEVLVMLAHDLNLGNTAVQIRKIREYCENTIIDLTGDITGVPPANDFVNSMIETGIIHLFGDSRTHYHFTIPSMQSWLLQVKAKELDLDPQNFRTHTPLERSGLGNKTMIYG